MRSYKVLCPGEALIDFVAKENLPLAQVTTFEKKAGGAPLNAAAVMSQFGVASYFMGSIANDPFGQYLINSIAALDVNATYVQPSNLFTTFAYVSIDQDGERDFIFNRGSDSTFKLDDETDLSNFDGFHFSSATAFLGGDLEKSYFKLLDYAAEKDKLIIFDPNYRHDLFKTKQEKFIVSSKLFIAKSNIVKLSLEELEIITDCQDIDLAVEQVLELGCGYVVVTLGSKGSLIANREQQKLVPSIKVKQVDTTGAGDAFIGYVVSQVVRLETIDFDSLATIVTKANIVGALTTEKYGAISAIPTEEQISSYL